MVVLDGPSNLLKVVALNDAARNLGIEAGMTKLQVETCGGVSLRKRSVDHEDLLKPLAGVCRRSSPPGLNPLVPEP